MFFWKIDEETIRCLINKQEMDEMGYDLKEISTSNERMEEFLNSIVKSSHHYIDWNTENGIQTYVARSLPADQFLFTISCTFQDVAIDKNLEQIERMTQALRTKISKERIAEIYALSGEEKEKAFAALSKDLQDVCSGNDAKAIPTEDDASNSNSDDTDAATKEKEYQVPPQKLTFRHFSDLLHFCSLLDAKSNLPSTLYKEKEDYILLVDFSKCEDNNHIISFIITAEEYGASCSEITFDAYFLQEHGKLMIENNSIEVLKSMA